MHAPPPSPNKPLLDALFKVYSVLVVLVLVACPERLWLIGMATLLVVCVHEHIARTGYRAPAECPPCVKML
jgi:hypothetical protein